MSDAASSMEKGWLTLVQGFPITEMHDRSPSGCVGPFHGLVRRFRKVKLALVRRHAGYRFLRFSPSRSSNTAIILCHTVCIVVTAMSFIRARALNHLLFQVFCEDIGGTYTHLYYSEGHWLSRGQFLNRVASCVRRLKLSCLRKATTWRTT